MYLKADTVDDLLRRIISKLIASRNRPNPTKGKNRELIGVLLHLSNPRARLSQTEKRGLPFSCLGELLWYLSKSDELSFISYYLSRYGVNSDDQKTVHGAYGPRLFNMDGQDQLQNIRALLTRSPDSRRAVIQLFRATDLAKRFKDIPCTCTMQFLRRQGKLHMVTNMRSNDAFIGLPHDFFAFTMLQEIMARSLGLGLGTYKHMVGSLHLYDEHENGAKQYLEEGWQAKTPMPPMPPGDPWPSIDVLLQAESLLRQGEDVDVARLGLTPYWSDLVRLLQIFSHHKARQNDRIARIKAEMSTPFFNEFIEQKRQRAGSEPRAIQNVLPFNPDEEVQ